MALAIALAIGGIAQNRSADQNPGPIHRPPTNPHETQTATSTTTRPIIYTDDAFSSRCDAPFAAYDKPGLTFCVGTLHVGEREVEIDQALGMDRGWPMAVTDAGAVYPNFDVHSDSAWGSVWFTDGGAPQQIAKQVCSGVSTGSTGSLAVWVDCTAGARGDLVVFDTGTGSEVARLPIPGCRTAETKSAGGRRAVEGCGAGGVVAGQVYFARAGYDGNSNPPAPRLLRLDIATGDVVPATPQMYARDLSSDPRTLVVGDSWRTGSRESGVDFAAIGTRLVPMRQAFASASNEYVPRRTRAFDASSGKPVRLRLPSGYHLGPPPLFPGDNSSPVKHFTLFEWLDDDTVALAQTGDNSHMGDIITCRLSTGACQLVATAPPSSGPHSQYRLVAGQSLP